MQSILFGNIIRREAMEHIGRAGQLYRISYIRRKGCFSLFRGKNVSTGSDTSLGDCDEWRGMITHAKGQGI